MQHADVHLLIIHLQEVLAFMYIHVHNLTHGLDVCCIKTFDNLKHVLAEDPDV
jgi:hypothetical protein